MGTLVLGNTYRHPALVAKMAATLDQATGGRFVLGLGAGWQVNEHTAYGLRLGPFTERLERLDEACAAIRGLLDQRRTTMDGRHYVPAGPDLVAAYRAAGVDEFILRDGGDVPLGPASDTLSWFWTEVVPGFR